jgi:hypothetical protein
MADPKIKWRWLFSERVGAFSHLPSSLRLVRQASPALTIASFGLRLARATLPVLMLYVGKLIIDEVVVQSQLPSPGATLADWMGSGRLHFVGWLLALEFTLAVLSDLLARTVTLKVTDEQKIIPPAPSLPYGRRFRFRQAKYHPGESGRRLPACQ